MFAFIRNIHRDTTKNVINVVLYQDSNRGNDIEIQFDYDQLIFIHRIIMDANLQCNEYCDGVTGNCAFRVYRQNTLDPGIHIEYFIKFDNESTVTFQLYGKELELFRKLLYGVVTDHNNFHPYKINRYNATDVAYFGFMRTDSVTIVTTAEDINTLPSEAVFNFSNDDDMNLCYMGRMYEDQVLKERREDSEDISNKRMYDLSYVSSIKFIFYEESDDKPMLTEGRAKGKTVEYWVEITYIDMVEQEKDIISIRDANCVATFHDAMYELVR